ncbi:MAG: LuxR C-terminal-related transcriptional regulator [Nitrososphaeraceae archaeon]
MTRKKSTKYQLQNKLVQIRKLQDEQKTNREISDIMNIPMRTVEFYVRRIYDQDKEVWEKLETESLESRALIIKRKYEELAEICEAILDHDQRSPRDRLEAGKTLFACHLNIYNMIKNGPLMTSK